MSCLVHLWTLIWTASLGSHETAVQRVPQNHQAPLQLTPHGLSGEVSCLFHCDIFLLLLWWLMLFQSLTSLAHFSVCWRFSARSAVSLDYHHMRVNMIRELPKYPWNTILKKIELQKHVTVPPPANKIDETLSDFQYWRVWFLLVWCRVVVGVACEVVVVVVVVCVCVLRCVLSSLLLSSRLVATCLLAWPMCNFFF